LSAIKEATQGGCIAPMYQTAGRRTLPMTGLKVIAKDYWRSNPICYV
jgi:hypothetical protein